MNINTIKALTWVTSAVLTAGVSYYVWDFQQHEAEVLGRRITAEQAKTILDSAEIPEGPRSSLVDVGAIERAYYFDLKSKTLPNLLDWTGARPIVIEVAPEQAEQEPEVVRAKLSDSLTVTLVEEDGSSPEGSKAWISYKPESRVALAGGQFPSKVRVGDKLEEPMDYVTVKAISADDGVTFSFDGDDVPDETVRPGTYDAEFSVYVVGEGQPEQSTPTDEFPHLDMNLWRPERSQLLGNGEWRIGTEDSREFRDDYAGILAREVRHSRHYNPKTRKYDGIELKEVKPGGRIAAHGGQSGDIIKSINGHAVTSAAEAITFVKNNKDKYSKWVVIVENKGKLRTMIFESPPASE